MLLVSVRSGRAIALQTLQDAVVRSGKFVILYKRPGHRVLINAAGDLIVRPSYVESSVRQRPGEHLAPRYSWLARQRPPDELSVECAEYFGVFLLRGQ